MNKVVVILSTLLLMAIGSACYAGNFHRGVKVVKSTNDIVDVIIKRVQFDDRYFLGLDGYYTVGDKLRQDLYSDKLEELYKQSLKKDAQIDLLIRLLAEKGVDIPNQPVEPQEPTEPSQPVEPQEPSEPNTPTEEYPATELDVKAYQVFKQSCTPCHVTSSKGGLRLVEGDALVFQSSAMRQEIFDRTYGVGLKERGKAQMPPSGALSDDKVEILRLWMHEQGARDLEKEGK